MTYTTLPNFSVRRARNFSAMGDQGPDSQPPVAASPAIFLTTSISAYVANAAPLVSQARAQELCDELLSGSAARPFDPSGDDGDELVRASATPGVHFSFSLPVGEGASQRGLLIAARLLNLAVHPLRLSLCWLGDGALVRVFFLFYAAQRTNAAPWIATDYAVPIDSRTLSASAEDGMLADPQEWKSGYKSVYARSNATERDLWNVVFRPDTPAPMILRFIANALNNQRTKLRLPQNTNPFWWISSSQVPLGGLSVGVPHLDAIHIPDITSRASVWLEMSAPLRRVDIVGASDRAVYVQLLRQRDLESGEKVRVLTSLCDLLNGAYRHANAVPVFWNFRDVYTVARGVALPLPPPAAIAGHVLFFGLESLIQVSVGPTSSPLDLSFRDSVPQIHALGFAAPEINGSKQIGAVSPFTGTFVVRALARDLAVFPNETLREPQRQQFELERTFALNRSVAGTLYEFGSLAEIAETRRLAFGQALDEAMQLSFDEVPDRAAAQTAQEETLAALSLARRVEWRRQFIWRTGPDLDVIAATPWDPAWQQRPRMTALQAQAAAAAAPTLPNLLPGQSLSRSPTPLLPIASVSAPQPTVASRVSDALNEFDESQNALARSRDRSTELDARQGLSLAASRMQQLIAESADRATLTRIEDFLRPRLGDEGVDVYIADLYTQVRRKLAALTAAGAADVAVELSPPLPQASLPPSSRSPELFPSKPVRPFLGRSPEDLDRMQKAIEARRSLKRARDDDDDEMPRLTKRVRRGAAANDEEEDDDDDDNRGRRRSSKRTRGDEGEDEDESTRQQKRMRELGASVRNLKLR